jgi:hypothetical protein
MSLAVDNPILNNPVEEPKEYLIYEEGHSKRMSGRRPAGYYFRTGKKTDTQIDEAENFVSRAEQRPME